MVMKTKLLLIAIILFSTSSFISNRPVTVFMIGDSTMANRSIQNKNNKERGWGMMLAGCLTDRVIVDNHAASGRSTKSFINEKRWERVLDRIQPGVYVFIQFGHNDEKEDPKLHTEPGTTFDDNLRKFVAETRSKGGIPVLFNSMVRRKFYCNENGLYTDSLIDTHGDYLLSPKRIAEEKGVVFIDMNKITHDLVKQMGPEKSKELFMWVGKRKDDTHLNIKGARIVASLAIEEVGKKIPALGKEIRRYDYVVATDGSGDFFTLEEALEMIPLKGKCTVLVRSGQYGPKPPFVNKKIKITEEKGVSWGSSAAHAEKPLKNLDLYLCVGQSNMAGRGKLSPEVMDTLRNVYLLNAEDKFEPAVNPLNRYSTIGKGLGWQQLGPAYGFAKEMATKKHPIGLIVNARGGSSIRSWVKNAKQSGGYYDEAVRRTKEAMKYGTLKAIIWHQGEADCHHSEAYREKITQLMTDLRNDLGMPDLPVVVGQIAQWNWTRKPHIPEGTKPFNDMIKEISAFLPHSACVSSEGLTPLKDETDPHFDAASQIILGRRYAKEVKKLINK